MNSLWKTFTFILVLVAILVWITLFQTKNPNFRIIACDVGQGDAILAIYGSTQVLTDGGLPNGKLASCLSKYLPFWDRQIELVINTHPQLDHYGGLIDILKTYKIKTFMSSSLRADTPEFRVLEEEVGRQDIMVVKPVAGEMYRLGLMRLEILWPAEEFIKEHANSKTASTSVKAGQNILGENVSENDPNDFSVNTLISFGDFDALLTGDSSPNIIDDLINDGWVRDIDYIKVPHHGSKNGLTKELLDVSDPEVAVISSGKNNDYGHPHKEIINLLNDAGIKTFRTDLEGDVVFETDGKNYWKIK